MALKGNKGEWSEVYVLLKLLGEGKVYSGDQNLRKIANLYYPILKIIRDEHDKTSEFAVDNNIVLVSEVGNIIANISVSDFLAQSQILLQSIKREEGVFSIPSVQPFLDILHVNQIKASSHDKTDIKIVIHDLRTGMTPLLGFSIKSQLGGSSTILNATSATNFEYEITGHNFTDEEIKAINSINSRSKILDRVKAVKKCGGRFIFHSMDNTTFKNNLVLIDSCLPKIVASILLESYSTGENRIAALVEKVAGQNPIGYDQSLGHPYYEHKIKQFLVDIALGFMPAKKWDGNYEANGGYLVVKEDGDILCYHFYDRNLFEQYMFYNTKLERGSTSRHKFASVYNRDGRFFFKLNLQIRFV